GESALFTFNGHPVKQACPAGLASSRTFGHVGGIGRDSFQCRFVKSTTVFPVSVGYSEIGVSISVEVGGHHGVCVDPDERSSEQQNPSPVLPSPNPAPAERFRR